jgi:DNA/RNA endonuclease YhcR with UshA esterase domain
MKTKMSLRVFSLSLSIFFLASSYCWAGGIKITASEASAYIGQSATVCGYVASAKYASRSKGQPTFLNLDKPYPNQIFTALIWGSDRPAFGTPEITYSGKNICVTGSIKSYRGVPEIIVKKPSQITLSN